ncbi:hypothetical protein FACS189485_13730 [Spirochaetia bacterium]|nr:hypothetical protein FACS189485_13730 [Spirochaetia bacterium]
METIEHYPLIPRPLPIDCGNVRGKLYIRGRLEGNSFSLCFVFNDPQELAPLIITVRAAGKDHTFSCLIRKEIDGIASVETPFFQSPFYLGEKFEITAVEALATVEIA